MPPLADGHGELGGEDHRTPVYRTPLFCNEEVNFAVDRRLGRPGVLGGRERHSLDPRAVLGPEAFPVQGAIEHGDIVHGGRPRSGWRSAPASFSSRQPGFRDMNMADPPVIANGVVFASAAAKAPCRRAPSAGHGSRRLSRIPESTHAVLYALDAQTGKELWSSGDQIKSWNHFSGLSVANGRVYIGTYDGMLYCFGIAK